MKNMKKTVKQAALLLTAAMTATAITPMTVSAEETTETAVTEAVAETEATNPLKYVFLFIGDGMSYPQIQATSDYLGAIEQDSESEILSGPKALTMQTFPVAGSATIFDSTSFCPDSASTATSISTGHKTYSGSINVDEAGTVSYETIAEKLKEQKDYKIGVISSVNLNHATPAAFYAHQVSRNSYYDIAIEMVNSNFDYFAGGALLSPTGAKEDQEDIYTVAENAGYKVVKTQADAEALTAEDGKAIVIAETLADSDSISYENDRADEEWALADYVNKGIEVLDNDNGFFMMVEGGKIDWACHANDAGSTVSDTIALDAAVAEAVEFYNEHPEETLIVVTGDHETGGLTIGYAGTDYDTFLTNLSSQKISYAKYDSDYVTKYKEEGTDFDTVMADITEFFGLLPPAEGQTEDAAQMDDPNIHPESDNTGSLVMTEYEYNKLKTAYETTMSRTGEEEIGQEEYLLYGSYEPLSVTITHILNNKSGINFSSYAHTGLPVAVLAQGNGQELFGGYYDNTEIYTKMAQLLNVQ